VSRRGAGPCLLAAVALAGFLLPLSPAAAGAQDSPFEEFQFQVDVGRDTSGLMIAQARDSVVYLPLRALLDLVLVRIDTLEPGVRLRAAFGAPVRLLGIETGLGVAVRGRETVPLDSAAVWIDGELYVTTALASWLLGVGITVYWSDLLVVMELADDLPLLRARRRELARRILAERRGDAPLPPRLRARSAVADGLVLDWALTTATRAPADNYGVQLGAGLALLGGGLTLQHEANRTPLATRSDTRWLWQGAWNSGPVRLARVGETATGGPRPFPVRGVLVSNAPFLRPAFFDEVPLRGSLPPGWEVELYRGGQMVGYTSAGEHGRWVIDMPVIYGPNPTDMISFGPRGEVVRRSRTVAVPAERLPARRFEYAAGAGECGFSMCEGAANLDLRYGLSNRVTVQGGYDRFWRDTLPDLDHPYGLVSLSPLPYLGVRAEGVVHGFASGRLDLDPTPDFHFDASYARFSDRVRQPISGSAFLRHSTEAALFWRPGRDGYTWLQTSGSYVRGVGMSRLRLRTGASTRALGVRMLGALRVERDTPDGAAPDERFGLDLGADAVLRVAPWPLRSAFVRVSLATECSGMDYWCAEPIRQVVVVLSRSLGGSVRLDLAARRDRGVKGATLDVALTMARPWMRASSRNTWHGERGVTGTQLMEGTVLWNRRRGEVVLSSGRQLGRGGLEGLVFMDRNANGILDPGEEGVGDVLLRVGSWAVSTDSAGRFSVWDLVPFADTWIEVDTLGLPNPTLVAANPIIRVPPEPNSFRSVAIALQEGAEVTGRIELDGQPIGGIRLIFTQAGTGRTRDVTAFSDGTFYLLGLPAGEWSVTPPPGLLSQLRARTLPATLVIGSGGRGSSEVVVRLVRE
jgi:hypothetical protein